jgi:methanogenic corrinoid protein MtbC1
MKRHISQQVPVAQAAEMAMGARFRLSPGSDDAVPPHEQLQVIRELERSLDAFDESSAERALQQVTGARGATAVLQDVVLPYLHALGERWAENHVSVAQEHFASQFFQTRLHGLARGWDRGLGPRAVIAAAPNDHHTLGLTCFGIALHRLGWRIVCLGPATPIDMLAETVAATEARLVCVSVSVAGLLDSHTAELRSLSSSVPTAIGGHAANAGLAEACGATYLPEAVSGAARLAVESA